MGFRGARDHPLIRYFLLGAALLILVRVVEGEAPEWARPGSEGVAPRQPIVVAASDVKTLRRQAEARSGGRPIGSAMLERLVAGFVDEEVLYREARRLALDRGDASVRRRLIEKARSLSRAPHRDAAALHAEALALGLDTGDVVIRRLLVEKMRLLLRGVGGPSVVTPVALKRWITRHRASFSRQPAVTLWHVYADTERDGPVVEIMPDESARARPGKAEAQPAAGGTRARLAARRDQLAAAPARAAEVAAASDPFPLGLHLRSWSRRRLRGFFGDAFAEAVFAVPAGVWSGPIASPFGFHLVLIEDFSSGGSAPLPELERHARHALVREQQEQRFEEGLARLRPLYGVAAGPRGRLSRAAWLNRVGLTGESRRSASTSVVRAGRARGAGWREAEEGRAPVASSVARGAASG